MGHPESLVRSAVGGSYFCEEWELRVTRRCLAEDLNRAPDSSFESVQEIEIVKALVQKRSDRVDDRSQVAPLTCGQEVWVLARGNDHRGATWYDEVEGVVWLLAYGRHRSGKPDDFFPYCKGLDAADRLLPDEEDYKALFVERDRHFAEAIRIEVPLILKAAREEPGEHRCRLGGDFRACIAVEVDRELGGEAITVVFRVLTVDWGRVEVVLAALHPVHEDWTPTDRLPSRQLDPAEVGYTCTREIDE